jgi:hypothetical protein
MIKEIDGLQYLYTKDAKAVVRDRPFNLKGEGGYDFLFRSCYSIFSFMCMLCRLLFVLLSFFFWPLCCLFYFNVRILLDLWYHQTLLTTNSL